MAHIVRRCIERGIQEELSTPADRYARALRLVGKFRDREGKRDVSVEHDAYLERALR